MSKLNIKEIYNQLVIIATHNGKFHCDDVFAVALLKLILQHMKIVVIRTRDMNNINNADIVVDVGGQYNEKDNRFDHHMRDFNLHRDNGIKYSSFGLVFKKYGLTFCDNNQKMADMFDNILVQPIDAIDNGQKFIERTMNINPYTISNVISDFNPDWFEDQNFNKSFDEAVEFAQKIILNVYNKCKGKFKAQDIVEDYFNKSENKEIIVLDTYAPWTDVICSKLGPKFVIFPDFASDEWRVQAVPVAPNSFELKTPLLEEWCGKNKEELKEITGIDDIVFVHRNGFIGGAVSKESCIKMAETVLRRYMVEMALRRYYEEPLDDFE
jgi:uncharacterized UPF0160 family protein